MANHELICLKSILSRNINAACIHNKKAKSISILHNPTQRDKDIKKSMTTFSMLLTPCELRKKEKRENDNSDGRVTMIR